MTLMRRFQPLVTDDDGAVLGHYGKYARQAVFTAFEDIGGQERFTEEANRDPKWYYEKFWTKQQPKETAVSMTPGVEHFLRQLDAGEHAIDITPEGEDDAS